MTDSVSLEKANYLGNKRRIAGYIVEKFPEDAKSVCDPMCGVSGVLIEAAKRGYRIKGNDLSIAPYWYSKGVFEGAELTDADVEKILNAPPHDGWLTKEWKGIYPRSRSIRRFIDGLAKQARRWKGPKGWAAKALLSRTLQTMYADSGSGYSTLKYESVDDVRRLLEQGVKEINRLVKEVSGKGTITNEDAKSMRFPSAEVVYFDPPFFRKDKGVVHYFQTYRVINSVLQQSEWKEKNLGPDDIPPILERLCKSCRHIFISTSSNEVVPYAKELARHKKTMKRFRVSYRQASGFGSRDVHQREHLYAAKAAVESREWKVESERPKAENEDDNTTYPLLSTSYSDPYMRLPDEDETHRYVVQEHWRGRSMHADFRIESVGNRDLIGWTLNTQIGGSVEEPVTTLEQAKTLDVAEYSKVNWETGEFSGKVLSGKKKHLSSPDWLEFEGIIAPGETGALADAPGVVNIVDKGVCEYGVQKDGFHEYFLSSDGKDGGLDYRITFTKFKDAAWLLSRPEDRTPYVLSAGAVEEGWVPPEGFSALPESVRSNVPPEYRYWQMERESERIEMRDALVAAVDAGEVELLGVEKSLTGEFEKRRLVPFNQWGGSAKYAKRLSKKFPEHKRYVEPFCGSAAVFFRKEPSAEAVLADADSEVVFALKYIQKLTPQKVETLKRFPWTVSRAGFERARKCKPSNDAERFWRLVYGRLSTWGGRPTMSGFSTLHEGQTYDLEDLWKFHEKLKGARILSQDWKETLRRFDGAGTLFFIDPPYVEEWGDKSGIPPEEIAERVAKLKGEFVIAYTDSARARRAFSKTGRLFTMKFLEARRRGLWKMRPRLFVASFGMKKSESPTDLSAEAEFVLQYQYFRKRGEKPVRSGPTRWHWDLRIDDGGGAVRRWRLDHDITKARETVGYFEKEKDRRGFEAEGFYPPGSHLNPTKDTPTFIEVVDKGKCRILVDQPALVKVGLEGRELKGAWLLEKKTANWHVHEVQAAPAAKEAAKDVAEEETVACSR